MRHHLRPLWVLQELRRVYVSEFVENHLQSISYNLHGTSFLFVCKNYPNFRFSLIPNIRIIKNKMYYLINSR